MAAKQDMLKKITELKAVANGLPAGAGRTELERMVLDLESAANTGLADDGTSDLGLAGRIPSRGLRPGREVAGDGLLACC
jgi:hypothetical protein